MRRGAFRWREKQVTDSVYDPPVPLFWERMGERTGSKARFHVAYRDSLVKCRQRSADGRASVAVNEYEIRAHFSKQLSDRANDGRKQTRQRLVGLHQIEIELRDDA